MKSVSGRINRRTYFIGSAISVATAGIFMIIVLIPFAFLELVLPNWESDGVIGLIQKAFLIIPAGYFLLMTLLLTSRRAQDFGSNGTKWTIALAVAFLAKHYLDYQIITFIVLIIIGLLCLVPGSNKRNKYGGKQPAKLNLQDVYRL